MIARECEGSVTDPLKYIIKKLVYNIDEFFAYFRLTLFLYNNNVETLVTDSITDTSNPWSSCG